MEGRGSYQKDSSRINTTRPYSDRKLKEDEKGIAMHRYVRDKQGKVTKTIYLNKDGKIMKEE